MKLSYLFQDVPLALQQEVEGIEGIHLDTRQIKKNEIFIALKGHVQHGIAFADKAVEAGAVAIVTDEPTTALFPIPVIYCPNLISYLPDIANRMWPLARHIKVIGITGTNGKTSTAWMLSNAFERLGKSSARMGTLGVAFKKSAAKQPLTTGSVLDNYRFLDMVASKEGHYAAMEVSSHALMQGRIAGLTMDSAIYTNLSRDHLDYHGTMQAYANAKASLFSSPGLRWAIVNSNDAAAKTMLSAVQPSAQRITYGIDNPQADVNASNLQCTLEGSKAWVDSPWGSGLLTITQIGRFQVENALAVICALCTHAVPFYKALSSCQGIPVIPGRLECHQLPTGTTVAIDFAHTPAALETALKTLKDCHGSGKVWCVFGCGGNRDTGKREVMGKVAQQFSDRQIITNDNPRWEDPQHIANHILKGMDKPPFAVCLDRKQAILMAIEHAAPEDVILVAGKGHEADQEISGKKYPLLDRDIVLSAYDKECSNAMV